MVINRQQTEMRRIKALTIVGLNQVKRITTWHYRVKSQSSDQWYEVKYEFVPHNDWVCDCPDHTFRKVICKHIESVRLSKKLRNTIIANSDVDEIETNLEFTCKCGSQNMRKDGVRKNKACEIQRYRCLDCGNRFCNNIGLRSKVSAKAITASLDLYFRGVSLRQVRQHLLQFYGINITHVAIYKWIRKFGEVVQPYVDQIIPKDVSGVYHVDEMVVHVRKEENDKGHCQWLWNLMDSTTRYWICSKISSTRNIDDARAVFQDAKLKSPKPLAIVHDGLGSYDEAFKKEFWTRENPRTKNIRSISVRKDGLNQKVERLNGIVRDREFVMRGMDHAESAQKLVDAFRIHYNFIRNHNSIKKTPAEQAGIKLDLGQNKIENLFKLAMRSQSN
ncbi:MAG: IS1/IS6 family transposase [Thaumarchaeota archaeon]|nr:IS1/IS6 family transposase [Nitrososphaerota archaeon]